MIVSLPDHESMDYENKRWIENEKKKLRPIYKMTGPEEFTPVSADVENAILMLVYKPEIGFHRAWVVNVN